MKIRCHLLNNPLKLPFDRLFGQINSLNGFLGQIYTFDKNRPSLF
jgi:hypothetical protein